MTTLLKAVYQKAILAAMRELDPSDSPDSISNTSIPLEKSWNLEKARLQTLATDTPI